MTREEARFFVNRRLRAYEQGDIEALTAPYADDCEVVSPIFGTVVGKANVASSFQELFRGLSDRTERADDILVDRERVAYVYTVTATHSGLVLGMPASGRRIEFRGVNLYTFQGKQISREHRIYDFTRLLLQLGVLRAKPA